MIKAIIFDLNGVLYRSFGLDPDLLELIKEVREKGIKVFLLSNISGKYDDKKMEKLVDKTYFSSHTGYLKPDP